jgi:hypothetical protein
VSAGLSGASQPGNAPISGSGRLPAWAAATAAVGFPFDVVLAGMVAAGQGMHAICLYLGLTRPALDKHLVRLGLRTPHERPLRKPGPRGWSVLDTIRLIAWRVAGIHPEAIAQRLGRSANAVRAKARRLGVPRPDRKALRRVDPARLEDPVPGFGIGGQAAACEPLPRPMSPTEVCGTSAGPVSFRVGADGSDVDLRAPLPGSEPPAAAPPCHGEVVRRPANGRELPLLRVVPEVQSVRTPRPDAATDLRLAGRNRDQAIRKEAARRAQGQPELPLLFPAISGAESPATSHGRFAWEPQAPPTPAESGPADWKSAAAIAPREADATGQKSEQAIPRTEAEVCLSGDLLWIGTSKKPLGNRAIVWALGMLYFGGLHWTKIAERIGKTRRATASLLHRCWVPRDRDRKKFGDVFDEEAARATFESSGFELALDQEVKEYFWRHQKDRAKVRQNRRRRREMGRLEAYRSEEIRLITQRDLDAMRGRLRAPFAENRATMRAW